MTIKIDNLFALISIEEDITTGKQKASIYSRIFINEDEANELAKEFGMQVKKVFINN